MAKRKKPKEAVKPKKKKTAKGKKSKKKSRRRKKKGGSSLIVFIIAILIIAAVIVVSKLKRGEPVVFLKADITGAIGATGKKPGQLMSPRGIAVSRDNYLYVTEHGNNRLSKFKTDGTFVQNIGKQGEGSGQFKEPSGVAVDRENFVYVADAWNGRIQKFTSDGKYVLEIGGSKAGFYSPRNVGVNKYGVLYVADTGTSRIHRFDTEGNRLGKPIGGTGKSLGKFLEVFGIAFDSKQRVYVGDPGNMRVAVLSNDLRPIRSIDVKGWQEAKPMWPMVAVDSVDRLYCVSSGTQDIWVYDVSGEKPKYIGTIKQDNRGKPFLNSPLGIAVDSQNVVYVSETGRNRVVKIRPRFTN